MTLLEQIKADMIAAMKEKDMKTVTILRTVTASVKNKAIDAKEELKDADVVAVVKSDVKKLKDALKDFIDAAREDLIEKTKEEIEVLNKYLPKMMSAEEVKDVVKKTLAELGELTVNDMGRAMGAAMKAVAGKADGDDVRAAVEEELKK
ncbi:MAG: GatB/YqeY domain-containing protein [bacterium]|nr:GatB/YqeY domain-containing protein [bacterium]